MVNWTEFQDRSRDNYSDVHSATYGFVISSSLSFLTIRTGDGINETRRLRLGIIYEWEWRMGHWFRRLLSARNKTEAEQLPGTDLLRCLQRDRSTTCNIIHQANDDNQGALFLFSMAVSCYRYSVNPSPPPPPGSYLSQAHLRKGGGLNIDGGLFNLQKAMVSVRNKELKHKYKKFGGHAAEDENQIRTSSW